MFPLPLIPTPHTHARPPAQAIAEVAAAEHEISRTLQRLEADRSEFPVRIVPYRQAADTYILDGIEEVVELNEQQVGQIHAMRNYEHIGVRLVTCWSLGCLLDARLLGGAPSRRTDSSYQACDRSHNQQQQQQQQQQQAPNSHTCCPPPPP